MLAEDFDGTLKLGYECKSQLSVGLSGVKGCSIDEFSFVSGETETIT
jgi:hypothetical protein